MSNLNFCECVLVVLHHIHMLQMDFTSCHVGRPRVKVSIQNINKSIK